MISEMMKSSIPSISGSTRDDRLAGGGPWWTCPWPGGGCPAATEAASIRGVPPTRRRGAAGGPARGRGGGGRRRRRRLPSGGFLLGGGGRLRGRLHRDVLDGLVGRGAHA